MTRHAELYPDIRQLRIRTVSVLTKRAPLNGVGLSIEAKMGQCCSSENSEGAEQKKRSQEIDKQIEEDSKKLRRECKILLLGWFTYIHELFVHLLTK